MSKNYDVNKTNTKWFGKALIIIALVFIVLIPNVEIWNMAHSGYTDTFHVIMSVLNFIAGFAGIAYLGKNKLNMKDDD